jgi:drug/metabolite transporter (DMT)-like permease
MNVWLALVLTTLSWAITFHLGHYAVTLMPPITAVIWRFVLATMFLLPLVSAREKWDWKALARNAPELLFMGAAGIGLFQVGMFYGLKTSTASNAALVLAFTPAMTVALDAAIDRRRVRALQAIGVTLGLIGVMVVVSRGQWAILRHLAFGTGDLWLLAAGAAWAAYSVVLKRRVKGLTVLQLSTTTIAICTLTMVIGAGIFMPGTLLVPPLRTWLPLLFMGVVASGLAYIWWNTAVIRIGAGRASVFMNLTPVFTMLIGVPLGEQLGIAPLVGAVLVIVGVVLATRS